MGSLETSTSLSQLPSWEPSPTTLQSPALARNPSLLTNQSQLRGHMTFPMKSSSTKPKLLRSPPQSMSMHLTTFPSQPQSKASQSSKRSLDHQSLPLPTKTLLPQLSTLVPSTMVVSLASMDLPDMPDGPPQLLLLIKP